MKKKVDIEFLVREAVNDRAICKMAGAKYDRINSEDVSKIREYLIRTYEEEVNREEPKPYDFYGDDPLFI